MWSKHPHAVWASVALLLLALGACQASPNLMGPTGIVALPTADIADQKLAEIVVGRQSIKVNSDDVTNWELKALGRVSDKAELWLAYSRLNDDIDSRIWGIGGKLQLTTESTNDVTMAVGGSWRKWDKGLLPWAMNLPISTQREWVESTPEDIRDDVREFFGFESPGEHVVTVSVSCDPTTVGPGETTTVTAVATDSLGHEIDTQNVVWTASVPGGTFDYPNPDNKLVATYTAPEVTADEVITLTATVTCLGTPPATGSGYCDLTVTLEDVLTVHIVQCVPETLPWEGGSIQLSAEGYDTQGHDISYHWTASPALPGLSFSNPDSANTTLIVSAGAMYSEAIQDMLDVTVMVAATCTGGQSASDQCQVHQMYQGESLASSMTAALLSLRDVDRPSDSETGGNSLARLKGKLSRANSASLAENQFVTRAATDETYNILERADVTVRDLYLVVSKELLTPDQGYAGRLRGSLGLLYLDVDPEIGDDWSLLRPFLGLEFIGPDETALAIEYRWKDSSLDQKALFSAVLRWQYSSDVSLDFGSTNSSPIGLGLDDSDWFARLCYTIPIEAW